MSDIFKNPVVIGAVCGFGGLFVGAMLATATLNTKISDGINRSMSTVSETMQGEGDAVAALSERIDALEAAIAENAESVAGLGEQVSTDVGARVDAIGARVSELSDSLGAQIAETSERLSQTASEQAAQIETALANLPERAEEAVEEVAASSDAPAEEASEDTAEAPANGLETSGEALGVGQTASLAEGGVRAFVQQFDAEAGTAVLSVNRESSRLAVGESVVARHAGGACRVGLGGVSAAGVEITSDCDTEAGSEALGDGYGVGSVALLADGALRVFVSGILGGDVRLAINGLETEVVSVGDTIDVDTQSGVCSVTVTGIRETMVSMTASCA